MSDPPLNNYKGYFIRAAIVEGAAQQRDYALTTQLATTTWTEVKLTWQSNGQFDLSLNNISVFNEPLYGSTDTSVTFRVGAASIGEVNEPKQIRYDNVEIRLDRAK